MTTYEPPKYGTELIVAIELYNGGDRVDAPIIAEGDFQVSADFGAFAALETLPTVEPAGSGQVKVTVSAAEAQGANVKVKWHDPDGTWSDGGLTIQTSARQIDDLAYPETSGRSLAVDASGRVTVGAILDGIVTDATFAAGAFAKVWTNATRTLTSLSLSIWTDLTTVLDLSGITIKAVTDPIQAEATLGDGAISSRTITPDGIAQLEALASSNDRTFTRGDTISTTLATLGHTWATGATMRLTMKPIASFAKDADSAATIGILLTTPAASSADGLVLLNKVVRTSSDDRGEGSLTRTDGSNTAVNIEGAASKDIAPGKYAVDVQVVEADGDVVTIVPTCTWTIEADVTRTTS